MEPCSTRCQADAARSSKEGRAFRETPLPAGEPRLALLEERCDALFVVLREAAERLTLGLGLQSRFHASLKAGVEGVFDPTQCHRRHCGEAVGQVSRFFREGIVGYYTVYTVPLY